MIAADEVVEVVVEVVAVAVAIAVDVVDVEEEVPNAFDALPPHPPPATTASRVAPALRGWERALETPVLLDQRRPCFCLLPSVPVAGRLQKFSSFWERLTSDPWILEIVHQGYKLELLYPDSPPRFSGIKVTWDHTGDTVLADEVAELCAKSAIERVPPCQERDGFYSRYFTVSKKDGGLRPILNLKPFNRYIRKRTFKMETLQSVIPLMLPGLWMASVDLKDAYFHVPIYRGHWKYLRFFINGVAYQFKVAPFGLSSAPRLFTKLVVIIIAWLRLRGVQLFAYLDDFLIVGSSPEAVLRSLTLTIQALTRAGFIINVKKSDLTPTQDLVYVGGRFRTRVGRVFLPEDRKLALIKFVQVMMRVGMYFPALGWLRLLGLMASTITTVDMARLRMRPIQWFVKAAWLPDQGFSFPIMMKGTLLPSLRWWTESENLSQGMPFVPAPHTLTLTTDSSMEGWGGHMLTRESKQEALFSGIWSTYDRRCHINYLELKAIRLTLEQLTRQVTDNLVLCECDNTTAVAYINRQGGTRSSTLYKEALRLFNWAALNRVVLRAVHRPGVNNQLADFLSRNRPDPLEWALSHQVCASLFRRWGLPQVDLFASEQNHKLPLWYSRIPCPSATAVDAFRQNWRGLYVYAFPPVSLILKTLLKLQSDQVEEAIVVAPWWPRRTWFLRLQSMATETPVSLPLSMYLLSQTLPERGTLFHPDLERLGLVAWKLSGSVGAAPALRDQL